MGKKGKAKSKGLEDSVGLEKALTMSLDDLHATLQGDIDMSPADEDQIVQQLQAGAEALASELEEAADGDGPSTSTGQMSQEMIDRFNEVLDRQKELEAQLLAAQVITPSVQTEPTSTRIESKVSLKDVKLEKFWGNKDVDAHVINKENFLPLLEWLESACFQIQVSGLPVELHVRA